MSLEYYGDSAINSVFDSIFMMGGVLLARRVPVWVSVAVVLGTEVLTTAIVRDGLALNTLMLLYPDRGNQGVAIVGLDRLTRHGRDAGRRPSLSPPEIRSGCPPDRW